jgi:rare lipoprotein A
MLLSDRAGFLRTALVMAAAGLSLGACAETEFVTNTTKEIRAATETPRKSQGVYKIGKPYAVDGVWYYPKVDYSYVATGIASWYGPDFQGKPTANGEIFDMNEVTAAHQTLPLPSIGRVTNLENGRSLLVRINDRGPFVNGRIIDVSRRTAQLLGFEAKGTAKVRVEVMADQSRQIALTMPSDPSEQPPAPAVTAAPRAIVTAEELPTPPGVKTAPAPSAPAPKAPVVTAASAAPAASRIDGVAVRSAAAATLDASGQNLDAAPAVTVEPVGPANIYIQAGAFTRIDNANRLRARLSPLGQTKVTPVLVGDQQMFRVRLGPVATVEDADRLLQSVIGAGYKDAQVIVAE